MTDPVETGFTGLVATLIDTAGFYFPNLLAAMAVDYEKPKIRHLLIYFTVDAVNRLKIFRTGELTATYLIGDMVIREQVMVALIYWILSSAWDLIISKQSWESGIGFNFVRGALASGVNIVVDKFLIRPSARKYI